MKTRKTCDSSRWRTKRRGKGIMFSPRIDRRFFLIELLGFSPLARSRSRWSSLSQLSSTTAWQFINKAFFSSLSSGTFLFPDPRDTIFRSRAKDRSTSRRVSYVNRPFISPLPTRLDLRRSKINVQLLRHRCTSDQNDIIRSLLSSRLIANASLGEKRSLTTELRRKQINRKERRWACLIGISSAR